MRGLRAEPAAPVHLCRHCGTPLQTERTRESGFCCTGCAYVFRLVHEHGLEGYYKIRDTVVAPVDQVVFQPRDYAWLAEMQLEVEKSPGPSALMLEVQGISCAGCVWLIEKIFHQQKGSLAIQTDAQVGRMRLQWARGEFDAVAFARALQGFNYLVGPPGEEPAVPESRQLVRRVGLCAAFSMNIMLFALPAYFGMEASFAYAPLFNTLAMVFATLSLLTGGSYFFGRALGALRSGVLHIDLPIAVGILGAYAGSFFGWIAGREEYVYFDFVGTFILLMLVGRWAQVAAVEHNRRRLLSVQARPHKVRVLGPSGAAVDQPVENLRPGDIFRVRSGQVVPVEAQLESSAATFGTAWITGEADPREYRQGGRVPAGAVSLVRGEIQLRALQGWTDSLLAKLLQPAGRDAFRHRWLERVVGGYLIAIFVAATLAGAGWWLATHDAVHAFSVVTAVLVVSCPCAIGLSLPLADEMATVALRRHGVFVREADLWPRLARIRKLIFDKTGTLTLETPVLRNPDALAGLAPTARAALLTLVRDNAHPVSQSLCENLLAGPGGGEPLAGVISEETGYGVKLETGAGTWTLGRAGWAGGKAGCDDRARQPEMAGTEFACDGVVLARFVFEDAVRADAVAEVAALRRDGFEAYILSGDQPDKVAAMARALGLPAANGVAGVSPEQKAAWVKMLDRRDTLMLGDGANDSLAFDTAFARGTPVIHRGVLEGKADFYYLGQGIGGLRRLFAVNAARRRTHTALLVFSVVYNAFAVGLAVSGHMNPLLAAIIMPVSSLLSLAIVGAGMRRWLKV
ncbi:heavy metal translocating P-type ATPase metal-binding domain-containing protein [Lacunisphaera limnophila]|uniref:heavy metal translocating P-type ATPase metal-binding domain-containing protein n=1 Tax=Lacunisphaera limnophila TaxID=1838286 RepID=UPI001F354F4A|nr:heavy metal translocating P-type ATPase metal-binding domain-containing protein [Lacunisphaera limnophila]